MLTLMRRVGVIAFGLAIIYPALAFAQEPIGIQVRPAIIEDNVSLGGTSQYSISVKNVGSTESTFYFSARDIKGLDEDGKPVFAQEGEQTGYELSSWITLPQGSVTLAPGELRSITFSVQVPNRASPGAHFGAIFLTNTPGTVDSGGSAVSYSVGTIVSLKAPGDVREEAQLREFSTDRIVYGSGSVIFNSRIENTGNILVRPHGIIEVTDMFGRDAGSVEVNPTGSPVFPNSARRYPAKWESADFAFGRYQATVGYSYGETESKTISATTSFWVLPIKPIAIILGILLALIVGMYVAIRVYIRRKLRDMGISANSRDADYYARKYQRSGSRMIVVTLVVFLICVFFLAALFLVFA